MPDKTVAEIRSELIELFKKCGVESPAADTGLILMKLLEIDKTKLLIGDTAVTAPQQEQIYGLAERRCKGEPVQYLTGECEFMSLEFEVNSGVLIPRADTEILVEALLERLDPESPIKIADIGCGSGCIGISLLHYMKNAKVIAVDISDRAVETAAQNAKNNKVDDRISFIKCDITKAAPTLDVDCVVSNPPYIRTADIPGLDVGVRCFEPYGALDGGGDGLDFYRIIAGRIKPRNGGILAFETGYDQGGAAADILLSNSYKDIEIIKDIEGRQRVVLGRL